LLLLLMIFSSSFSSFISFFPIIDFNRSKIVNSNTLQQSVN
jgi:hypothetical protein